MRKACIGLAGIAIAVFSVVGVGGPVFAHQESTVRSSETPVRHEEVKKRVQGRLDEARRQVCQTRAHNVGEIMKNAAAKGQRNLTAFKNIYTRVTEFYNLKRLTLANYNALASAAQAKYEVAAAAVKAAKEVSGFDCNGDDPVGVADQYKGTVKVMHDALNDYRSAVHAMLVAVKTAAGSKGAQ